MPKDPKFLHLKKVIDHISRNTDFAQLPNDQVGLLGGIKAALINRPKGSWDIGFPQIEIPITDDKYIQKRASLIVGCVIHGNYEKITWQSLSVCIAVNHKRKDVPSPNKHINVDSCCSYNYGGDNWKNIVRQFHFDYQPEDKIKPESHLQYGGIFHEQEHLGNCHYCLDHKIKHPRIYFPPMDLVLVLDFLLRNFETSLNNWIEDRDWKGLVRKSQKIWWNNYWLDLHSHSNGTSNTTLHEYLYNEST